MKEFIFKKPITIDSWFDKDIKLLINYVEDNLHVKISRENAYLLWKEVSRRINSEWMIVDPEYWDACNINVHDCIKDTMFEMGSFVDIE